MKEQDKEFLNNYLDIFENNITQQLLKFCTDNNHLEGKLLQTPDIEEKWESIAAPYMADALKEIAQYPAVSLGWMMYVGMAMAAFWDGNWEHYANDEHIYEGLRDLRGFDCMDEAIRDEVLGLSGEEYDKAEKLVRSCAQQVLNAIRHENIVPQSTMAYYVYVRSIRTLFNIGVAVQLKRLGYRFEKM